MEQILKISNTGGGHLTTTCVVLVEYVGFESDLYMLQIDAGGNCSGGTFEPEAGKLKIENFLHSANRGTE
jgi:hypothetical protein